MPGELKKTADFGLERRLHLHRVLAHLMSDIGEKASDICIKKGRHLVRFTDERLGVL